MIAKRITKRYKFTAAGLAVLAALVMLAVPLADTGEAATSIAPAVEMQTGDTFSYHAETNLPSAITAAGDGLAVSGGFLSWDAETDMLTGTAAALGTYTVVLTAVWAADGLTQTAEQQIRLTVTAADGDPSATVLTYDAAADVWDLEFTSSAQASDGTAAGATVDPWAVAALVAAGLLAVLLLRRFI